MVAGGQTIFTVNGTNNSVVPLNESVRIGVAWSPYGQENQWIGSFAEVQSGSGLITYRDLVAPANELNVGDQLVVNRTFTEIPGDANGGFSLTVSHEGGRMNTWTIGTYPACMDDAPIGHS